MMRSTVEAAVVEVVAEGDVAVVDGDLDANPVLLPVVPSVVIDGGLAAVDAVRNGSDLGLHHLPGGVEERPLVGLEALPPVLLEEPEHAALAHDAGADLGAQVLANDVEADVGEDEIPDVPPELPLFVDLDGRDAERFLPDLGRVRVVSPRDRPPDVGLVSLGGGPGDELVLEEDRFVDGDVVVLVSHAEDVVVEDDVSGMDVVTVVVEDVLAYRPEREGEDGEVLRLLQHVPLAVVEPGDEVLGLAENGRPRGLLEADAHLVGDGLERPRQHREQNRVDLAHAASPPRPDATVASIPF